MREQHVAAGVGRLGERDGDLVAVTAQCVQVTSHVRVVGLAVRELGGW